MLSFMSAKIRLYVDHPLGEGQTVPLSREQAHYLFGVMRLGPGGQVLLFNGRDGEWRAEITGPQTVRGLDGSPGLMPPIVPAAAATA